MSENILQKIRKNFPNLNLEKLSSSNAKEIANKFFRKCKRHRLGTSDLIKIKVDNKNVFSSFQEDEKTFYKLELTMEQ